MVVGDGAGSTMFNGGFHTFETQVGPAIEDSYPVLMTSIPEFVLPTVKQATRGNNGLNAAMGFGGGNTTPFVGADSPEWMLDGEFAVQVVMWNPGIFPNLPEQFSVGLDVTLLPNGRVITTQFGDGLGEITFWSEIDVNEEGQTVVRFPFSINGL